jgi:hypothetical protein
MQIKVIVNILFAWFFLTFQCLSLELPSEVLRKHELAESIDALKKSSKASEAEIFTGTDRGGSLKSYSKRRILKNIVLETATKKVSQP